MPWLLALLGSSGAGAAAAGAGAGAGLGAGAAGAAGAGLGAGAAGAGLGAGAGAAGAGLGAGAAGSGLAGLTAAAPTATGGLAGMSAAAPSFAAPAAGGAAGGAVGGGSGILHSLLGGQETWLGGQGQMPPGMVGPAAPSQGLLGVGGHLSPQGVLPHTGLSIVNQKLGGLPAKLAPQTFANAASDMGPAGATAGGPLHGMLGGVGSLIDPIGSGAPNPGTSLPQGGILPSNAKRAQVTPYAERLAQKTPNYMEHLMGQNIAQRFF